MYCSKCGTKNDDDSRFCIICGNDIGKDIIIDNKDIVTDNKDHSNILKIVTVIGLLIIISGIVLVVSSFYNKNANTNDNESGNNSTIPTLVEVYISSIPTGANIYVNDTYKGNAPKIIMLSEGKYHLKTNLTGYKGIITDFNISSDMTRQDINVTLAPIG